MKLLLDVARLGVTAEDEARLADFFEEHDPHGAPLPWELTTGRKAGDQLSIRCPCGASFQCAARVGRRD